MRKVLRTCQLAAIVLLASATTALGQGAKSLGVVAGVDFATFNGTDFSSAGSLTGFIGGLYVNVPVGDRVSVEPEVLYASKGAKDTDSDLKVVTGYIEIPVLVRYDFNAAGGPYLLAGPAVGLNLSCKFDDDDGATDCSDLPFIETNTTFGGVVGLGYQKGRVGLEGRYDFDFGNAFKDLNGKNAAWEILARIMLK